MSYGHLRVELPADASLCGASVRLVVCGRTAHAGDNIAVLAGPHSVEVRAVIAMAWGLVHGTTTFHTHVTAECLTVVRPDLLGALRSVTQQKR